MLEGMLQRSADPQVPGARIRVGKCKWLTWVVSPDLMFAKCMMAGPLSAGSTSATGKQQRVMECFDCDVKPLVVNT